MFTLADLPYAFNALEPYIDERTMQIHHDKHHAAYVKNLNDALAGNEKFLAMSVEDLIKDLSQVPEAVRTKVRNNGGGHANHSLFWSIMSPSSDQKPEGNLKVAIDKAFINFENFQKLFTEKAMSRFGSGWAWLIKVENGGLTLEDTPNQDSPLIMNHGIPILGLDVWEHAYYLKYQNLRADYIKNWWNVVNWPEVSRRYAAG